MQISFWKSFDLEVFINGYEIEVHVNGEKQDVLVLSDMVDDYLDRVCDIDGKIETEHKDQVDLLLLEFRKSVEMINEASSY